MDRTTIALAVLGVLLVGAVAGGSTLVAAERTVLDSGYVTGTIAADDRYEEIRAPFVTTVRERLAEGSDPVPETTPPGIEVRPFDREAFAESAVAEAFGPARIDDTIEGMYGYLHGRQGREVLTLSLDDVKAAYARRVTEEAIDIDAAALADVGGETEGPMAINGTTVERLRASESSYLETRADFRESLPDGTDREALAERTKADIEPAVAEATADEEPAVTEAVIAIQFATVDALAGDLTYETYQERIDDAEADLRSVAGDRVRERIDELAPETIALDGEDGPVRNIDDTRAIVGTLDLLVWVVPAVALGLIGLVYGLTRSMWTTARTTGGAFLTAAAICVLIAILAGDAIAAAVDDTSAADGGDFGAVIGSIVDGFLDALVVQSLVVAVLGVVLFGVVWADRTGRLDGVRSALGRGPVATARGTSENPEASAVTSVTNATDRENSVDEADTRSTEGDDEPD
ncbi:hypothetical protein [Halorhabdus amylolytica]|uniref:hypothetical protein n=1 Tax=Halorhabdus amylolytica TaxID=2559573 RepID=UPI0010AA74DE|nr:hypothetical protein [Halorhabdus amylolytica]